MRNNPGTSSIGLDEVLVMSENYPILINGEETGQLTVRHSGLITEFTGRCPDPGRLVRLSVYGGGTEGYLGVMEPLDGQLYLCRKFSRASMAFFPKRIEYAAEAGEKHTPAPPPSPEPEEKTPPARSASRGNRSRETDLIWYSAGDGSLYTAWDGQSYRAIPMAAWGLPLERAVERRVIDGVEYAVFALDNGQIV